MMAAVRVARAATQRSVILKFEGCYHGHADSFLVKAGSGIATLGLPDSPGVPAALAELTVTVPFNDRPAVEDVFARRGKEIAAVIVEPYVGNAGFTPPDPGFHGARRALCDRHGAVLIFDEVMTGFRVAPGGAAERLGVRADLTTLGKIIGGGLPVGAYGGRADLMRMVAPEGPVYQAGTLAGNPVAMAAGLATLRETERPGFYDGLERRTARLVAGGRGAPPPPAGEGRGLRRARGVGAPSAPLGGEGELFARKEGTGRPMGSTPAGVAWTVVPDTGGLRLVPPGGSPTERHAGISAVSVTENRFAMVSRRRYRGRVNVVRAGSGLTVMNRVPVESYLARVFGGEIGIRRAEEAQALVAQAVVSRSFALKNRGR